MRRFAGACRFVFNRALARQNENHEAGNKYIPYGKMASWLVEWKNATETQWLKDSASQPLQQSLKDLERAYKNFFQNRAAFPRFKKRGQNDAFRYPQGVKLDQENSRIFLPKLGWMRYRNSRQVTGVVKNVTVSQSCGKWYISIQTESEVSTPVHPSASMVGLDAGVAKLATLSDGTVFEPVNSFQKNQKKLARLPDPDEALPAVFQRDLDQRCSGVEAVFHKFFDYACGTFHDFTGCDLIAQFG